MERVAPVADYQLGGVETSFDLTNLAGRDFQLVIDPDDNIAEITEQNNRRRYRIGQ